MSEFITGEYKGHAMAIIRQSEQDKFPFQFGMKKAELILLHLRDIARFVAENGGGVPSELMDYLER